MPQINPFIIEGYHSPEYFCDRINETALLKEHLTNQRNVALIAERRLGKSGLILNSFAQEDIQQNYYTFYIDIYDTKNLAEFTYALGKGILDTLKSTGRKSWERFLEFLKSLRSTITFDVNGMPKWTLSVGEIRQPDVMLDEIFYYLENAEKPCLVAIDEFQVIGDYPEKTVEATLRKRIQNMHNTHFVYSGSKRHMMTKMFMSKSRPFYNSTAIMGLQPIDCKIYLDFANHHLEGVGKVFDADAFKEMYEKFDGVTWYLQYLLNVLYAQNSDKEKIDLENVEEALRTIVSHHAFAYRTMLYQLAPKQKQVLRAIAQEGKAQGIMSKDFLNRYNLTSSTVQGAVNALLDRDFLTNEEGIYMVYDRFFEIWLKDN